MSRPFNKAAYDQSDLPAKIHLKELIEKSSSYKLISDINKEYYKLYDLEFSNGVNTIRYETEVRKNFDKIIDEFTTIHIPYRKKDNRCDKYIVWKDNYRELIVIERKIIDIYMDKPIEILCNEDCNVEYAYRDIFIDIPKTETKYYVINDENNLIELNYD